MDDDPPGDRRRVPGPGETLGAAAFLHAEEEAGGGGEGEAEQDRDGDGEGEEEARGGGAAAQAGGRGQKAVSVGPQGGTGHVGCRCLVRGENADVPHQSR